jgi:hypothetical protein
MCCWTRIIAPKLLDVKDFSEFLEISFKKRRKARYSVLLIIRFIYLMKDKIENIVVKDSLGSVLKLKLVLQGFTLKY